MLKFQGYSRFSHDVYRVVVHDAVVEVEAQQVMRGSGSDAGRHADPVVSRVAVIAAESS